MNTVSSASSAVMPDSSEPLTKLLQKLRDNMVDAPCGIAGKSTGTNKGEVFIQISSDDCRWHPVTRLAPPRWREKICSLLILSSYGNVMIKEIVRSWEPHLSPGAKLVIQHNENGQSGNVIVDLVGSLGDFSLEQRVDDATILRLDPCIHHWLINRDNTGICKLCGRFRDFGEVMKEAKLYNPRRRMALTLEKPSTDERRAFEKEFPGIS